MEAVGEIGETFPERFQALVDGGLSHLANHNLENGIPDNSGVQHPLALNTRLYLADLVRGEAVTPGLALAG
jgi:hypothetical protein